MNKRYYEHTLPIIRGSLSNTYPDTVKLPQYLVSFEILVQNLDSLFVSECFHNAANFMLNLELPGVSLFIWLFP